MAVTAALVKALRDRTGAGMMECKKALVETDGDIEAAVEHLRKTGLAKADKKAGRTASEGRVLLRCDGQRGVLVEVNSETDFVAKDENFSAYAESVAEAACKLASDNVSRVLEHADASGTSLEQARQALVAKLGENIQVRRIALTEASGTLGSYLHGGRIGVLVEVEGGDEALAKDIAMHIAASKPAYISEQDVPTAVVDKEKEIFAAQARESGKPEEIIDKMVVGRLRKYLAEITLLGQAFVKNPDQSVAQLLKEKDAKVTAFQRLEVGEGIEKKDENFAEEVMAQVRDS